MLGRKKKVLGIMSFEQAMPIVLALIMFSLGIGLKLSDFQNVIMHPKVFLVGIFLQLLVLPVAVFSTVSMFGIVGHTAIGFMVLSACPGGITSNMFSKLAKGNVALSVSLTAITTVFSVIWIPVIVGGSVAAFGESLDFEVNILRLALSLTMITLVPLAVGMILRGTAPALVNRISRLFNSLAFVLFSLVVVGTILGNWDLFRANLGTIGPALLSVFIILLLVALALTRTIGVVETESKTIVIDTTVQNPTLGITVASQLALMEGFGAMALPSAVYGVIMLPLVSIYVVWSRYLR